MKRKGFTLIELIVVIAIIGILAAIIAPNAFKAIEKGKIAAAETDYRSIKTGAMSYYADTGTWPADGVDENTSPNPFLADDGTTGWDGPYLEKWPAKNPWGGGYTWNDDSGIDWDDDAVNDDARYVAVDTAPNKAGDKIDIDLDGTADPDVGTVVYDDTADPTDVNLLVSRD